MEWIEKRKQMHSIRIKNNLLRIRARNCAHWIFLSIFCIRIESLKSMKFCMGGIEMCWSFPKKPQQDRIHRVFKEKSLILLSNTSITVTETSYFLLWQIGPQIIFRCVHASLYEGLSISWSIRRSIRLSFCPSVRLSVRPSVHPSILPPVCLSVHLSVHPSIRPSVCLFTGSLCQWLKVESIEKKVVVGSAIQRTALYLITRMVIIRAVMSLIAFKRQQQHQQKQ